MTSPKERKKWCVWPPCFLSPFGSVVFGFRDKTAACGLWPGVNLEQLPRRSDREGTPFYHRLRLRESFFLNFKPIPPLLRASPMPATLRWS